MRLDFNFLIPLLVVSGILHAQPTNTTGIDYFNDIQKSAQVPNSTEAQGFMLLSAHIGSLDLTCDYDLHRWISTFITFHINTK